MERRSQQVGDDRARTDLWMTPLGNLTAVAAAFALALHRG